MFRTINISVESGGRKARAIESIGGVVDHHYNTVVYGGCTKYAVQAEVVKVLKPREDGLSALVHYRTPAGVEFVAGEGGPRELDTFRLL